MMQGLLAAPRQIFTAADVLGLLRTLPGVAVDFGVELLDDNDRAIYDISAYALKNSTAKIHRDCTAEIGTTFTCDFEFAMTWGRRRVRPYMLMSAPAVGNGPARFDLGVFVVTTPNKRLGQSPDVYTVTAYDKIYLLQSQADDAISFPAGSKVLDCVRSVLIRSGAVSVATVAAQTLFDSTKANATLPAPKVYPVYGGQNYRWAEIVNDLLSAISYQPLYCDWLGRFCSGPVPDQQSSPVDWTFDAGLTADGLAADAQQASHTIVSPDERSLTRDNYNVPNRWRFFQSGLDYNPVEGGGIYTRTNPNIGPSSFAAIGRWITSVQQLTAASQDDLKAQGDVIVASTLNTTETITWNSGPVPLAGQYDIVIVRDPTLPGDDSRTVKVKEIDLPLTGGDMTWTGEAVTPNAGGFTDEPTTRVDPRFLPVPIPGQTYVPTVPVL